MKDIKAAVAKPRKVALYASLSTPDWYTVWSVDYTDRDEHYQLLPEGRLREIPRNGYVRISEPVEVRFTAISDDAVVQNAVAALNEEERKAIAELNAKVAAIRERKQQLLSLTHDEGTSRG